MEIGFVKALPPAPSVFSSKKFCRFFSKYRLTAAGAVAIIRAIHRKTADEEEYISQLRPKRATGGVSVVIRPGWNGLRRVT